MKIQTWCDTYQCTSVHTVSPITIIELFLFFLLHEKDTPSILHKDHFTHLKEHHSASEYSCIMSAVAVEERFSSLIKITLMIIIRH